MYICYEKIMLFLYYTQRQAEFRNDQNLLETCGVKIEGLTKWYVVGLLTGQCRLKRHILDLRKDAICRFCKEEKETLGKDKAFSTRFREPHSV